MFFGSKDFSECLNLSSDQDQAVKEYLETVFDEIDECVKKATANKDKFIFYFKTHHKNASIFKLIVNAHKK